jgi:hypothetical protein
VAFQHFVDQGFKSGTHDQSESTSSEKILASDEWDARRTCSSFRTEPTPSESNLQVPNKKLQLLQVEPYSSFPVSSR